MAKDQAFDDPWRENIQPGIGHCAPECGLHKAVGQATAKGDGIAVAGEIVEVVARELMRPLAITETTRRIDILHKVAIQQAVKMKTAGNVVSACLSGAVGIPSVTQPEGFNRVQMLINHHHIVMAPYPFQSNLNQDREKMPVIIGDGYFGTLAQPAFQIVLFSSRKRLPDP